MGEMMRSNVTQIMDEYENFVLPRCDAQVTAIKDLGLNMSPQRTTLISPADFGVLVEGLYCSQYTSWSESFSRLESAKEFDFYHRNPTDRDILSFVVQTHERNGRHQPSDLSHERVASFSEQRILSIMNSALAFVNVANQLVPKPHTFQIASSPDVVHRAIGSCHTPDTWSYIIDALGIKGEHDFMSGNAVVDMKVRTKHTTLAMFPQLFMYAFILRQFGYVVDACEIMNPLHGTLHRVEYTERIHELTQNFLTLHGQAFDRSSFIGSLQAQNDLSYLYPSCLFDKGELVVPGLWAYGKKMYSNAYYRDDVFLDDVSRVFDAIDNGIRRNAHRLTNYEAQLVKAHAAQSIAARCFSRIDAGAVTLLADRAFNGDVAETQRQLAWAQANSSRF